MNLKSILSIFSKNSLDQDKKQKIMIGAFVGVVVAIVAILYFGMWRSPSIPDDALMDEGVPGGELGMIEDPTMIGDGFENTEAIAMPSGGSNFVGDIINKINFDTSFLKTSRFQDLKAYGEWPLEIGEKGRLNPFLPHGQ